MAIINPKKATRTVNKTLSGSMMTPAFMLENQVTVEPEAAPEPKKTPGTREIAKPAVIRVIKITKMLRALTLKRAITGTNKLQTRGIIQTSHEEMLSSNIMFQPRFHNCLLTLLN